MGFNPHLRNMSVSLHQLASRPLFIRAGPMNTEYRTTRGIFVLSGETTLIGQVWRIRQYGCGSFSSSPDIWPEVVLRKVVEDPRLLGRLGRRYNVVLWEKNVARQPQTGARTNKKFILMRGSRPDACATNPIYLLDRQGRAVRRIKPLSDFWKARRRGSRVARGLMMGPQVLPRRKPSPSTV